MVASSCRPSPKLLGEGLSANMRLVPKNSWHDYTVTHVIISGANRQPVDHLVRLSSLNI